MGVPGDFVHVATGEAEIELTAPSPRTRSIASGRGGGQAARGGEGRLCTAPFARVVLHRRREEDMEPMGGTGRGLRARVAFMIADPELVDDVAELTGALGITVAGFLSSMIGECLCFYP